MTHVHDQNVQATTSRRSQRMPHYRSAISSFLLAILLAAFLAPRVALGASLMPQGKQAYFDANGDPLAGGKVYTYAAGTTTPLATYSDQAGTTPNANPVVLDARGEATIFWGAGPYKVSLYTSADVLVWTQDNMYPPFTAGEALGAALKLYSGGSAAEPELTWGDDTNSGLYLIGADNVGLSLGGAKRWDFGTAGSTLTGTFDVTGATSLGSSLYVTGASTFAGAVTVNGAATFAGAATFNDPVTFADPVTVTSNLAVSGTLSVTKATTLTDPVTCSSNVTVSGTVSAGATESAPMSAGANWGLTTNVVRKSAGLVSVMMSALASAGASFDSIATLPAGARPHSSMGAYSFMGRVLDDNTGVSYVAEFSVNMSTGVISMGRYDNGTSLVTPFVLGAGDAVFASFAFPAN